MAAPPKLLLFGAPNGPLVGPDGSAQYAGWRPDGIGLPEGELPEELPDIYSSLSPYRDKLLFLEGLTFIEDYDVHRATSGMLTGRRRYLAPGDNLVNYTGSGISLDQYLAGELDTGVLNTAFKIAGFAPGESYWSFRGHNDAITPVQDPASAYAQVFGDGLDQTESARILAQRTSVLDVVAKDLGSMQARVPAADRARLEEHLNSVRSLEKNLVEVGNNGCNPTDQPGGYDPLDDVNCPTVMRHHADIIAQAFACGSHRIATMQIGSFGGELRPRWPELGVDSNASCHAICHAFDGIDGAGAGSVPAGQAIALGLGKERAYSQMFAYVLEKLSTTLDVDGQPLLENTLVAYCRPMGRNHNKDQILWITAGGSGVGLRGGRFLQVGDGGGNKRDYNDFLTAASTAMGHPLETFGEEQFCREPIDLS